MKTNELWLFQTLRLKSRKTRKLRNAFSCECTLLKINSRYNRIDQFKFLIWIRHQRLEFQSFLEAFVTKSKNLASFSFSSLLCEKLGTRRINYPPHVRIIITLKRSISVIHLECCFVWFYATCCFHSLSFHFKFSSFFLYQIPNM